MSTIGTIFAVLNLALAAFFVGAAASFLASDDNYRVKYEAESTARAADVEELETKFSSADEQRKIAERLRDQAISEKNDLDVQKAALQQDIAALDEEKARLTAAIDENNSRLSDLTASVETFQQAAQAATEARVAALEKANQETTKAAEATRQRASAEDQVNALSDRVAELERMLTTASNSLQATETILAVAEERFDFSRQQLGAAAPSIDGSITNVGEVDGTSIVQINRGENDQVKPGYTFEIFNTSTGEYKGQAVVELVHANTCTAVVKLKADSSSIMQGDRVRTIL